MRYLFIVLFALLFTRANGQNSALHYHIVGNVNVKDGTKISLVLDSKGKSNRQTITIKNHQFEFSGVNPEIEGARLMYENDLLDNDGRLSHFTFFLGKEINIESKNDTIWNFKLTDPDSINLEYKRNKKQYGDIINNIYSSAETKDLPYEEQNSMIIKKVIELNVPVVSIVNLAEISILYDNSEINDSMALSYLLPVSDKLKQSNYYKRILRKIDGKKMLSEGNNYIDFEVEDTLGQKHRISSLLKNDDLVIIDFYTTWCAPCRMLAEDLSHYYDQCHNAGFDVICISCDDTKDDWKEYVRDKKPKWNSFWIDNSDTVCDLYNVHKYPTVYHLQKNGIITGKDYKGLHSSVEKTFHLEHLESILRED